MNVLDYFKIITKIPRCSFKTQKMKDKIVEIANGIGYKVKIDNYGNVLCVKGDPKVCLQAHYDMVCIGEVENIELIEDGRILKTKNSTLGADNGMGMAIMFYCMEKFDDLECLFTNDEEVGLVGASNLKLQISSKRLLNLDGEYEKDIYIGCAGGIDVISKLKLDYLDLSEDEIIYKIDAKDFVGGHSGVDIDKGIDSALKILAKELVSHDLKLLHIEGGEFRNSIAKNAVAVVASAEEIKLKNSSLYIKCTDYKRKYIKNGENIIKSFHAFAQGVRGFNKEFNIPSTSINLGVVRIDDEVLEISCAARAMKNSDLEEVAKETASFFELIGCKIINSDGHAPWVPNIGSFAKTVEQEMLKVYEDASFCAIHAGLECGILIQSQSEKIEAVAIGPTIRFPHSLREECDLDSVERIKTVVENIIKGV